ncbi:hypothetical protein [Clostridium perfringens]|uniref:hypothetical protein n=1 Tax=Clostridium perfringens TaxID=1502 RepID=UPI0028FF71D3|nr:hypothetical protein [Clostridium perfringens]
MNKEANQKLLLCILGSIILILLQLPIIHTALFNIFGGGSGANMFTIVLYNLKNLLSFIGTILLIIFSITLIFKNIKFLN